MASVQLLVYYNQFFATKTTRWCVIGSSNQPTYVENQLPCSMTLTIKDFSCLFVQL